MEHPGRQCSRCVLPQSSPDIWLDDSGVCNICREYERTQRQRECQTNFLESDLIKQLARFKKKKKGRFDCLVMCSGGKDSTSTLLYAVRRYHLEPLAFTFDHDFETEDAVDNVRRAVETLGVEWLYYRSDRMKEMFARIIKTRSRAVLCHLCSMWYMQLTYEIASNFKIPVIIAGWTKGQAAEQPVLSKCACDIEAPEYRAMGEATQRFLDTQLPQMPRYKGFPNNMGELVARARKKYKISVISPHWFLNKPTSEYVEEIKRELGWRYPRLSYPKESTNCYLNFLSVAQSMKHYGYTHYHVEMSKMIRMGLMVREDALELLKIDFGDDVLDHVLGKMGCTLEDIQ